MANKYLRQGAAGSGTGADWTNAYTSIATLESNLARGDVGYVADGTYSGSVTWDTAVSGTTLITLKKATVADHGTSTGWDDTYGDGQAEFSGEHTLKTNYLLFDGVRGDGTSVSPADTTAANYGFYFSDGDSPFTVGNTVGPSYQNITIRHVYALATASDVEKIFFQGGFQISQVDNVTIEYCLLDGWQNGFMARHDGGGAYNGCVWQYNVCLNGSSTASNHGEWINANSAPIDGMIVRCNIFQGANGGSTATVVGNNSDFTNGEIYGNVFDGVEVGNAVISGTSVASLSNCLIYNNTFANCEMVTDLWIDGPGTGNVAKNNLLYSMSGDADNVTRSYNHYVDTTNTPSTGTDPNRTTGTGDPFVNLVGGVYTLTSNTTAGTDLGAPYNVDMLGNTRTTWTRGALEFASVPSVTLNLTTLNATTLTVG